MVLQMIHKEWKK